MGKFRFLLSGVPAELCEPALSVSTVLVRRVVRKSMGNLSTFLQLVSCKNVDCQCPTIIGLPCKLQGRPMI